MNMLISLVFLCILLNTAAQILLKEAMNRIGEFSFALSTLWPTALKLAMSPFILLGIVCYVLSMIFWLAVLSRIQVSVAYPLASLGYITTAIAASLLLGENFSLIRVVGIFVIIAGVYLVAQS